MPLSFIANLEKKTNVPNIFNNPGGNPAHNCIGRHIPVHDGTGSHNRVISYGYTRQDRGVGADSDIPADPNRSRMKIPRFASIIPRNYSRYIKLLPPYMLLFPSFFCSAVPRTDSGCRNVRTRCSPQRSFPECGSVQVQ